MEKLILKGHITRGKEVIDVLTMLGGSNYSFLEGEGYYNYKIYYFINELGNICYTTSESAEEDSMSLEEFEEKYPYRVGDNVKNRHTKMHGVIHSMRWQFGEVYYKIAFDNCYCDYTVENLMPVNNNQKSDDGMSIIPKTMKAASDAAMKLVDILNPNECNKISFKNNNYPNKVELDLGNDYELKIEDGKTFVVKKELKYPKTFEECCDVLDIQSDWHLTFELNDSASCGLCANKEFEYVCKLEAFRKLLICRDAYWKLANFWEPEGGVECYAIYYNLYEDKIDLQTFNLYDNILLCFPTKEMRDSFYENFKDLIEKCKELL